MRSGREKSFTIHSGEIHMEIRRGCFHFIFIISLLETRTFFFLATLSGNKTEILLLSALNLIKFKDAS